MSNLYIPPSAAHDIWMERWEEKRKDFAQVERQLQELDPLLEITYFGERIPTDQLPPGAMPGRWHVKRNNVGTPNTYTPIVNQNGEYTEPDSGLVEGLRKTDLWKRDNMLRYQKAEAAQQRAREAAVREQSEERKETFAQALRAYAQDGPGPIGKSVAFGTSNWRNRAKARKG